MILFCFLFCCMKNKTQRKQRARSPLSKAPAGWLGELDLWLLPVAQMVWLSGERNGLSLRERKSVAVRREIPGITYSGESTQYLSLFFDSDDYEDGDKSIIYLISWKLKWKHPGRVQIEMLNLSLGPCLPHSSKLNAFNLPVVTSLVASMHCLCIRCHWRAVWSPWGSPSFVGDLACFWLLKYSGVYSLFWEFWYFVVFSAGT